MFGCVDSCKKGGNRKEVKAAYSEFSQTSKMEHSAKIAND